MASLQAIENTDDENKENAPDENNASGKIYSWISWVV